MSNIDIVIIGGAGHIGLPLAVAFASKGKNVLIFDINQRALDVIEGGVYPHLERHGQEYLDNALTKKRLYFSSDPSSIKGIKNIILTIGTPIDEFLNPTIRAIKKSIDDLIPYISEDSLLVLRSTVFPGTTDWLSMYLKEKGSNINIAFCPERITQGESLVEFFTLPQIVSGTDSDAIKLSDELFRLFAPEILYLSPKEAEFAKLFTNAYRYINFAVANQFYMVADNADVDYHAIHKAMTHNYPRSEYISLPGFTAGPCLFKDTMQLAAFAKNHFSLGQEAIFVNEGLPLYIIDKLKVRYKERLSQLTIGLLGMAFKQESDDIRSSLSYKLKKHLCVLTSKVLTTDPYVKNDPELQPLKYVIEHSDILIICAPHLVYRDLDLSDKDVEDVWGIYKKNKVPHEA